MTKESIYQEDVIIITRCALYIRAPKYIKETLTNLKREIGNNTIIVGDFITSLSVMDRVSRQNISKNTVDFNNTIDQMELIEMYRTSTQ